MRIFKSITETSSENALENILLKKNYLYIRLLKRLAYLIKNTEIRE